VFSEKLSVKFGLRMLFVLYTIDDCNGHQITLSSKQPLTIANRCQLPGRYGSGPTKIAQKFEAISNLWSVKDSAAAVIVETVVP
jgi:hypothetical protein